MKFRNISAAAALLLAGTGTAFSQADTTISVNGAAFTMIAVEGGTFTMGATADQGTDAYDFEKPEHEVTLGSFSIGETEVTQELWTAVMGSNPSRYKDPGSPVERVSWNDCMEFISRLNSLTGMEFRLPTEAQWEYAARGGGRSKGCRYSGSDDIGYVAWHRGNSGRSTRNVKTLQPNELGIYDMSGNVLEWCSDRGGDYTSGPQGNPAGPSEGPRRINRGGSCLYDAGCCKPSTRFMNGPGFRYPDLGLRLAL